MSAAHYDDEKPEAREEELSSRSAFSKLLPFLARQRRPLFVCLLLLIGTTVLSLAWPWLIQQAIDGPLQGQIESETQSRDFKPLLMFGGAILLIQALMLVMQYHQRVKLEIVGQDIMLELKTKLFRHIVSLDISFFDEHPVGRLMSRVESDTESLRLLFTNTVVLIVGDLLLILGIWGMMAYKNWRLALVLFALMPVIVVMIFIFHKLTTHRFLEVRKRMADVTASLTEYLHGMSIIQIFNRGKHTQQCVYRVNERKFSEDAYVNVAVCIFFNVLFFMEYLKIGLVLLLGSLWGITPGVIVLFILLIWKEFDPIARTADQLGSFQKGIAGARRIFALMDLESTLPNAEKPHPWPGIEQDIRFENVWFSYTDDENWVLKDVSFSIPAGQRAALAGVTGGGKSTIISLLLRLYDPQRGRITIDGVNIRDLSVTDLRTHFALVLQDIILFPGDIASNISLEVDGVSEAEILAAAKTVDADRFIAKLPDGYKTEVSEKGANFSRGERQLLSFARALVVNPDVLILDEATSSVDPETERTIQHSLEKLTRGRTSLIIAHRLATILDADQILVLRGGTITEQGSHQSLLEQDGYYANLFRLQFKTINGDMPNVV
jgi:ATP-binding cassette, subfamily B, multidrug efflux pump